MISYLSSMMLQRSPLLLVLLGGILFAIVRWQRHPRISFFTLLGLVLYLLKLTSFAILFYSIPRFRESLHLSYGAAINLYTVLEVLNNLAFAAIIILLVVASFAQRTTATTANN